MKLFPCSTCKKIWNDRYGYIGICDDCDELAEYDRQQEMQKNKTLKIKKKKEE